MRAPRLILITFATVLSFVPLAVFAHFGRPNPSEIAAVGDPLPRIQCGAGYTATIYAEGLASPDGLAFSPDGILYVAEESAGRVSRIGAGGLVTPVLSGLSNPEGIAFDDVGNLYVVEDVENGRLVKMEPGGVTTTLASGLDAPEGVVWTSDGTLYITESNVQFSANPFDFRTHVTAVFSDSGVTRIRTDTLLWSYAGITLGPDGLVYVTNEASGTGTNDSVLTVDPMSSEKAVFTTGLSTPEGLRFSHDSGFPLYVVQENEGTLARVEADGTHAPFCTGFGSIEDVALDREGRFFVSEDSSGWIIRIEPQQVGVPDVALAKGALPEDGSTVTPGDAITYTLIFTNSGAADATGLAITDPLPSGVNFVEESLQLAPGLTAALLPPPTLVLTGTLPAGVTLTASFWVTVATWATTTITNTAWLTSEQIAPVVANPVIHRVQGQTYHYVFLPIVLRH